MKKRVVFASVLKPVDDPRMYLKMARSLVPGHKYEIFIIGYPSSEQVFDPDITFLPLKPFSRLGFGRLMAYQHIRDQIFRLQPDVLIINTHELLHTACRMKQKTGCRIIYDVRENYYDNLKRTGGISRIAAGKVRKKEMEKASEIDHFTLAEKCYSDDLKFIDSKYTILENKALDILKSSKSLPIDLNKLAFTGTLAEHTGVFEAIRLTEQLRKVQPSARLTICGNSFQRGIIKRLKSEAHTRPWLHLDIAEAPLPYPRILKVLSDADAGIVLYEEAADISRKMPTKIYEYIGARLPIILKKDSAWSSFCAAYPAAIEWTDDPEVLLSQFRKTTFYQKSPGNEVCWNEESKIFRALVGSLL